MLKRGPRCSAASECGASSFFEKHILRMVWVVRQLLSLDLKEAKALLDILVGEVEKRSS
jgi:hypothetical protein